MSQFKREVRYVVLKATDLQSVGLTDAELDSLKAICSKVDEYRRNAGKLDLECLVVEKDWPEYEPTWQAIEHRVTSQEIEWRDGTDTSGKSRIQTRIESNATK